MKYRLIEKTYESTLIETAGETEWLDLGAAGCDSIAFQVVASESDTPGTATIQLQGSLDGASVTTVGSAVSVTGNGVFSVEKDRPAFRYYRLAYAIASGSYVATTSVLAKGDKDA